MDFEQIKKYWDGRAASDSSAQSTTMDFYLREIEFGVVKKVIENVGPATVMDVGCGDARTTARLASEFTERNFFGGDYSESMVKNARQVIRQAKIHNLDVMLSDVCQKIPVQNLDMVYTTRCLINLPSWDLQKAALRNIAEALAAGGQYVMIENFVEGQNNLNRIRVDFGLPEIAIREHNHFFEREPLLNYVSEYFDVLEEVNISSTYYLVSRVIYSKICKDSGVNPDYFDVHHRYAAQLPFSGEYGPVRMIRMRRK